MLGRRASVLAALLSAPLTAQTPALFEIQRLDDNPPMGLDEYGYGVDLDGSLAVVGVPGKDSVGAAEVLRRGEHGEWLHETFLTSSQPSAQTYKLGTVVAIHDSVIVLGCRDYAYVLLQNIALAYRQDGGTWGPGLPLVPDPGGLTDGFGAAVAVHDDVIVVGAPFDEHDGLSEAGAAYVFRWNGATWSQEARLTAVEGASFDHFGWAVAVDGDTVLVGATGVDVLGPGDNHGAVYSFERADGSWPGTGTLAPPTDVLPKNLGSDLALDGARAVAGIPYATVDGFNGAGAVCVFVRDGPDWRLEATLLDDVVGPAQYFGNSVDIDGDVLVAACFQLVAGDHRGLAHAFRRTESGWSEVRRLVPVDIHHADAFGSDVAIDDPWVLVGDPYQSPHGVTGPWSYYGQAGAAFVFDASGQTWDSAGGVLPSTWGPPILVGQGEVVAGDTALLTLVAARPQSPTIMIFGLGVASAPFKGGVLVPTPDLMVPGLVTNGVGGLFLHGRWPDDLASGLTFVFQAWIADAGGPHGFAASNAVVATVR
ncbi:MAG TPA: hypothetical protein VFD43_01795 [Planctomycetota bacterium]|nr:hypothetical protein [Planctomycetota bacterium]